MKNVIFGQQKMFFRQNVSRTLFLYIDSRAACKKWANSDGPILRSCFFVPDFAGSQAELLAIRGPSPNGKDFDEKKNFRPPSGKRLRGKRYLAYVVERHASACLRTVGVDIWMWKSGIQEETLNTKTYQSD